MLRKKKGATGLLSDCSEDYLTEEVSRQIPLLFDYQGKAQEEYALEKLDKKIQPIEKDLSWAQRTWDKFIGSKNKKEILTESLPKLEKLKEKKTSSHQFFNNLLFAKKNPARWNDPLPAVKNELLINLNSLMEQYNKSRSKEIITAIIKSCDVYIQSIPFDRRKRNNNFQSWSELLPEWPFIERIFEIQKNAVNRLFLPEAKTDNLARKILFCQLFGLDEKSPGNGKILDAQFWPEYKFKGKLFIAYWLKSSTKEYDLYLRSYEECLDYNKKLNARDRAEFIYFDNPEENKIRFEEGLAYLDDSLLDNSRDLMYVMDEQGEIYVCPDRESRYDFHHSSFLSGKKIICAGEMLVTDGKIEKITNESGHYMPGKTHLVRFLEMIQNKHHLDLSNMSVEDFTREKNEPINALRYLNTKGVVLSDADHSPSYQRKF